MGQSAMSTEQSMQYGARSEKQMAYYNKCINTLANAFHYSVVAPTDENPLSGEVSAAERETAEYVSRLFKSVYEPGAPKESASQLAAASYIDPEKEYPDPSTILSSNDIPVLTQGDFSAVVGQAGTRKSWFCLLLAACYLSEGRFPESSPFEAETKPRLLLWIDTEQGASRVARTQRRLARAVGETSGKYMFFSMREFEAPTRLMATAYLIIRYKPALVVIDGIADLMNDPNDVLESALIRQFLLSITSRCNNHIIAVIHSNEKSIVDKARGHVGSEVSRKASTMFNLTSEGVSTTVAYDKTRDSRPEGFSLIIEDGLPKIIDMVRPTPAAKKEKLNLFATYCKRHPTGVRKSELLRYFVDASGKSASTAKRLCQLALEMEIIEKSGEYYYEKS